MNFGYIAPVIETKKDGINYVLGSANLAEPIINPSGDWMPYLPVSERQNHRGVETNGCTLHGTESAIEQQIIFKTGKKVNYSERYLTNVAKTRGILDPRVGADPHKIAEMRRKDSGTIPEERAPWSDDIQTAEEYYSLDTAPLITEAKKWYGEWQVSHKWLWTTNISPAEKRARIQDALTKGTVCASVKAWHHRKGLYYKPEGSQDNHWVNIPQAKGNEPYKCLDSYPESEGDFIKDLDPLYDFGVAKVYFVDYAPHLFLKNLKYTMTDPEVEHLQRALISLGYPIPHGVTPFYGVETRHAVWKFQVANGISDDGSNFGPLTRAALNRALNPYGSIFGDWWLTVRSFLGV